MGAFSVSVGIARIDGQRFEPLDALVDTGSTYTWLPSDVLADLEILPSQQRLFELADGRQVHFGMAWILMRLEGLEQPTLVTFGTPGITPLLGVVSLEEFGLGVGSGQPAADFGTSLVEGELTKVEMKRNSNPDLPPHLR